MHRTIIIGHLLLAGHALHAQAYIPMLTDGATWQDENRMASPGPNTSSEECVRYYLDGDSVVDGLDHAILRMTGRRSYSWTSDPVVYDGAFIALLREDTVERRVYIRPAGWQTERLFYDFSVGRGPYPPTYRFYGQEMEVTSVDTVWLTDGPHRRSNFGEYEAIIEGVGATSGFMRTSLSGEVHYFGNLVCHVVDGVEIYGSIHFNCPCGIEFVGIRPMSVLPSPRVGPSPTDGYCWLRNAPPGAPYRLSHTDGRVLVSGSCSGDGTALIDLGDRPSGTYILEVMGDARCALRIVRQ